MNKISVVIDTSGSMNTLGKPDIIQSIIRELQLTTGIDCNFYLWREKVEAVSDSANMNISVDYAGKTSIQSLLDFLMMNATSCLLLTDGFSNEDKSNLTAFLRDNSSSKLKIVLVGADSRIVNGKLFFPENLMATEVKKYIFNALEASAAIDSLNY